MMLRTKALLLVAIVGLIVPRTPASAAPVDGAQYAVHRVQAHDWDYFELACHGGEVATVVVLGDGDTDLDLFVFDDQGHLIAADVESHDECVVTFAPGSTGVYIIVVVNHGAVYNEYQIAAY